MKAKNAKAKKAREIRAWIAVDIDGFPCVLCAAVFFNVGAARASGHSWTMVRRCRIIVEE